MTPSSIMPGNISADEKRGDLLRPLLILLLFQVAWMAGTRVVTNVGWGLAPRPLAGGMVAPGWMTNLTDSLGYASFLQQNLWNGAGTSILYTTTPHPAGYFNPLFWAVGRIAALTDTRPEAWLIFTGIVAALTCTTGIYFLGNMLGGRAVAIASAAICAFGSGWTWIQRVAAKLMGWEHFHGADLRFMDLLPSSAGLFYPLHASGLALMTWIVWLLLSLESLPESPKSRGREMLVVLLGFLLGWLRPYEPAVLLGTYGLYVAAGLLARDSDSRRRLRWLLLLFCAVIPGLAYAAWLASRPVWNILSGVSLSLVHERAFWLQGFGGLWLAGAIGTWLWRGQSGPRRFATIWFLSTAVLLLVINTPRTKLLSGAGLAMALVAGPALVFLWTWLHRRYQPLVALPIACGLMVMLAGPGSLFVAVRETRMDPPRIEADLVKIAARIRQDRPAGIPTVLADYHASGVLPGIIGARVWAGHWVLTDDGEAKQARQRAAGLEPDSPRGQPRENLAALESLLRDSRADYLLVRRHAPVADVTEKLPVLVLLAQSDSWTLYACTHPPAQ